MPRDQNSLFTSFPNRFEPFLVRPSSAHVFSLNLPKNPDDGNFHCLNREINGEFSIYSGVGVINFSIATRSLGEKRRMLEKFT